MADGLTAELKAYLLDALGAPYRDRLVSSEPLVVDYASMHTPAEDAVEREASAATLPSCVGRSRTRSSHRAGRP